MSCSVRDSVGEPVTTAMVGCPVGTPVDALVGTRVAKVAIVSFVASPVGVVIGIVGLGVGEGLGASVAFDAGAFVVGDLVEFMMVGFGVGANEGSLTLVLNEGAFVLVALTIGSMLSITVVTTIVDPFKAGGIVISTCAVVVFCTGGVRVILENDKRDFKKK